MEYVKTSSDENLNTNVKLPAGGYIKHIFQGSLLCRGELILGGELLTFSYYY